MANFSHYPLQKALYDALSRDLQLMSMATGVFDHPPQGQAAYPYIVIGESAGRDWSSKTAEGMEHNLAIHVWSREGGRRQAVQVMERIHTLVHQQPLALTGGQALILIHFVSSGVTQEPDGLSYQGTMRFRALVEALP